MSEKAIFHNGSGISFLGVCKSALHEMHELVRNEYGLLPVQTAESASYSLAMVVRFALGLSAKEGRVCALVGDCLESCICLATLRHLINSGAEGIVLFLGSPPESPSEELAIQLNALDRMGASFESWSLDNAAHMRALFGSCHNILCGLHSSIQPDDEFFKPVVDLLNDIQTPVHCVSQPLGINSDTGEKDPSPLYASSTLSLGAPLQGLFTGHEYAGRHYLCDVSITKEVYQSKGTDLSLVFAEQPVVQIFPLIPEEESDEA